jgi:Choice-of-anchor I domain
MLGRSLPALMLSCLCLTAPIGVGSASADGGELAVTTIKIKFLGAAELSEGVAEISAYEPVRKRLYIVDGSTDLKVLDLSDPANPTELPGETVDLAADLLQERGVVAGGANSVAVLNWIESPFSEAAHGWIAAAVEADPVTDNGFVAFYSIEGNYLFSCEVGALPDMLTFTSDRRYLLVADEGEPDGGVDPAGSVAVIDVENLKANGDCDDPDAVRIAGFEAFDGPSGAEALGGQVRLFPGKMPSEDFEPEYIAVSHDSRYAWVSLQEANALARLDVKAATFVKVTSLGLKKHRKSGNGLDASDKDGKISIRRWPVYGMYMPDAVASFSMGGTDYVLSANEGDDRGEDMRIKDIDLDPAAFPKAAKLQADERLGRLGISSIDGDVDQDGDYDRLQSYGARSFSIWNHKGRQVFDSGDFLEQKVAEVVPELFNADNGDPDDFDTRSDNKGPEPESVVAAELWGKPYAFVGMERAAGGVMAFDLSDPTAPAFVDFVRRDEDVSPEGLLVIDAPHSPIFRPLLVVSHEVSGTVAVYQIRRKRVK